MSGSAIRKTSEMLPDATPADRRLKPIEKTFFPGNPRLTAEMFWNGIIPNSGGTGKTPLRRSLLFIESVFL